MPTSSHFTLADLCIVSEMAWTEFEELKAENERLLMLQSEAENYAHRV